MVDDELVAAIVAALQSGDFATVERQCRTGLQRFPDEPKLLFLLGCGLRQEGRAQAALEPFSRLVEVCPDEGVHWNNYAAVLALVGDVEAAARAAQAAVRLAPDETLSRVHRAGASDPPTDAGPLGLPSGYCPRCVGA